MRTYIVRFTVNGKTHEVTVSATSYSDAERLVKAQYPGQRVSIVNVKDTTTGWYG